MKNNIIYSLIFIISLSLNAQISFLQDAAGETSFLMNNTGVLVNAADSNIAINFYKAVSGDRSNAFGGAIKFKANDGFVSLVNGKEINPELELQGYYKKALNTDESTIAYWYVLGSVSNSRFNLFKEQGSTLKEQHFNAFNISIGYNRTSSFNFLPKDDLPSSYLLGLAFNFGRFNNLSGLKSISSYNTINTSGESVLLLDEELGFVGDYKESYNLNFALDFYFYPQQFFNGRIGVGGYMRSLVTGNAPRNNIGFGALIGKEGAPSNVVLGVFYQFNDIFNQLELNKGFIERSSLNIITGYKF